MFDSESGHHHLEEPAYGGFFAFRAMILFPTYCEPGFHQVGYNNGHMMANNR